MKILVTPTSLQPQTHSKALEELRSFCDNLVFNPTGRPLTEDELIPLLNDCDGYIAGLDYITEKVINSCPNLRVISRYGAGYDRVDIKAAKKKNITVTCTPGANAVAVGELTFALLLSVARKISYLDNSTRNNKWIRSIGIELAGKTIGIVGLGAIGKIVARCARGFNMNVMAYDPYIQDSYFKVHQIENATFEELIKKADVITLHLPLNESTRHIINKNSIAEMKDSTIIINTSRGGLIDEEAVYEALEQGKLGGLGLDAFESEPPENSPLFSLNNVVVTPHTGAHTIEATQNMAFMAVKNVIDVLSGNACPYIIS